MQASKWALVLTESLPCLSSSPLPHKIRLMAKSLPRQCPWGMGFMSEEVESEVGNGQKEGIRPLGEHRIQQF